MQELRLVLDTVSFPVGRLVACQVCDALAHDLFTNQWRVQSQVRADVLRLFISAVEGETIEVTNKNVEGLSALCKEFRFGSLSQRVEAFKNTPTYQLARLEDRFSRLEAEVSALRSRAETQTASALTQLQKDMTLLNGKNDALQTAQNNTTATLTQLQSNVRTLKEYTGAPSSLILSDFPEIFDEFRGKPFTLLWRGSRDGFGAFNFHHRCDGHANTLTVILDMKGNIFGGFTPVRWDSTTGWKVDPSQKSFIFTLKNPHNVPVRRFALSADKKGHAIYCYSDYGPHFRDMSVQDNCNANTSSSTRYFGLSYTNDTGRNGERFFTDLPYFQVKEIEVFEISA
jgi:hypothetical protein